MPPDLQQRGYLTIPTSEDQANDERTNNHVDTDVDIQSDDASDDEHIPAVAGSIPLTAWFIAIVEAGERFAFFGVAGPLQNYIELPAKGGLRHGGLGLGQRYATLAKLFFTIWCYITPIFAAIIADQYFGRYRTIVFSTIPYVLGLLVLTASSLFVDVVSSKIPALGLVVAMICIGIGTGGIKANVSSLVAEQYQAPEGTQIEIRNGSKVRIDYEATIQRLFLFFYMVVNLGSLGALATAAVEQEYGFVPTYGLSLLVFTLSVVLLVTAGHRFRKTPPAGPILPNIIRIFKVAIVSGFNLDSAKPQHMSIRPSWNAEMVDDVRKALYACRVLAFLPFWFCAYAQIITNLISQAGTMRTGSIPNDMLVYVDALTVILLAPIFDRVIYPALERCGIHLTPLRRIAIGYFVGALAMAYATLLQKHIYLSPPCYDNPLSTDCEGGRTPNDIHVLWQVPVYLLVAISEIFTAATGVEFAYACAPPSMKSLITSLYTCAYAAGMVLAIVFQGIAEDPYMTWFYGSLTLEVLIGGLWFCFAFRHSIMSGKTASKAIN